MQNPITYYKCFATLILFIVAGLMVTSSVPVAQASTESQTLPPVNSICDPDGVQASGAIYRICFPASGEWNGDLVVYAHGYVPFNNPPGFTGFLAQLYFFPIGGVSIIDFFTEKGYAFATTTYSTNGLAILEGMDDIVDVTDIFIEQYGEPGHIYLAGASQGGAITTLLLEKQPGIFDGGIAICGAVGDPIEAVNYFGDVRLIFDYLYPGVIPGDPFNVPDEVFVNWETVYVPQIEAALRDDASKRRQFMRVAGIPMSIIPEFNVLAGRDALWYAVFFPNDAIEKFGGLYYDNSTRLYLGSNNDWRLNRKIPRYTADPAVIAEIEANYQTTGHLTSPLVTYHNLKDPIVRYRQEINYQFKTWAAGTTDLHTNLPPSLIYGHCTATPNQYSQAFDVLVDKVEGTGVMAASNIDETFANEGITEETYPDYALGFAAPQYGIVTSAQHHDLYMPVVTKD